MSRVVAPVATMRLSKVTDLTGESSWPLTSIDVVVVMVPQPSSSVILFFFIR